MAAEAAPARAERAASADAARPRRAAAAAGATRARPPRPGDGAEEALARPALAEVAPIGLFHADAAGRLTTANARALEIFARPLVELAGDGWRHFVPAEHRAAIEHAFVAASGGDAPATAVERWVPVLRPSGEQRWARLRVQALAGNDGRAAGFAGTIDDVGEEREALLERERAARADAEARAALERRLAAATAELDAARRSADGAARVKSEFLAMMSHEVRTPLNGVIGLTSLLLESPLTSDQRDLVETVHNSGSALLGIMNDILDLAKLDAGRLELESAEFDLRSVVEQSLEVFITRAEKKGLELGSLVETDVPRALCGDPGRLRQVLLNLIGNALKFTARGEIAVRVELAGAEFGRSAAPGSGGEVLLRFSVRDTGIGIPPNRRAELFEAFAQLDASHSRRYGGTGLGLAICERLVDLMRGEIGVESVEGQGSTFWFTARLRPAAHAADHAPSPRASLAGARVLIVDDSRTNRGILRHHCRAWGMRTETARDALDGLRSMRKAVAEARPFDVVVLETLLPGMDGFEMARVVRDNRAFRDTKLVLLASAGLRGDGERARRAGIDGYALKPIRESHLFDCLAAVLAGAPVPEVPLPEPTPAPLALRHAVSAPVDGDRPLVLIAEDNPVNQKLALRLVSRLGYRGEVVENGADAVAACAGGRFAAVLMDCQMPVMDGFAATRAIRSAESDPARRVPIIAMTANALRGDRERCLGSGMDDYLAKPVRPADLEAALARWVRPRRTLVAD